MEDPMVGTEVPMVAMVMETELPIYNSHKQLIYHHNNVWLQKLAKVNK